MKTTIKILSIVVALLAVSTSVSAKPNLDKARKKVVGDWSFECYFTLYPPNGSDYKKEASQSNQCLINNTYHFYQDGTAEIKTLDAGKCATTESGYRWIMAVIRATDGKEYPAIVMRKDEKPALDSYDGNTSGYKVLMVVSTTGDRLEWAVKPDNGLPKGKRDWNLLYQKIKKK